MKETIHYWYGLLTDKIVREKAFKNLRKDNERLLVTSLNQALSFGFNWTESPEGHEYWADITYKLDYPEPSVSENDAWMKAKGYDSSKKIIGYKAPYDLFQGRIKKGEIFTKTSAYKLVMYTDKHTTSGVATEIVKTWEPVYQPDEVVITVGRPEVNVTISASARIEAKGHLVGWGIIEQIQKEMTLQHLHISVWSVSYPEVVIGCSRFSRADIDKIWETFCKLNPNRTYETNRG